MSDGVPLSGSLLGGGQGGALEAAPITQNLDTSLFDYEDGNRRERENVDTDMEKGISFRALGVMRDWKKSPTPTGPDDVSLRELLSGIQFHSISVCSD